MDNQPGGKRGEGRLQLRIEPKAFLRTCVCLRMSVCVYQVDGRAVSCQVQD